MTRDGAAFQAVSLAGPVGVFVEGNIQNPVQLVLDSPVGAHSLLPQYQVIRAGLGTHHVQWVASGFHGSPQGFPVQGDDVSRHLLSHIPDPSHETIQFTANWRFDINEADELYVGYDDGGVGWVGNLTSIHVIDGPKILDVDIAKVALQSIEQDSLA